MTIKDAPSLFPRFPNTRYMGSKMKLLPVIAQIVQQIKPITALDAFSGSGCVSYTLKDLGIQVDSNDFLKFAYHIANASIANSSEKLSDEEVAFLINTKNPKSIFIQSTFKDLYFSDEDNKFLDNLWPN